MPTNNTKKENEIKVSQKAGFREYSAAAMLISGVGLAIAGFVVEPVGEISDSVLWFISQCLIYAGSMMGVSVYATKLVKSEFHEFRRRLHGEGEDGEE